MKITIKIREKKIKAGKSLYFDIYSNGRRDYKFLGLTLTGNKAQDRITYATAEEIRIKDLAELQRSTHGLAIESKVSLLNLLNEVKAARAKQKTKDNYSSVIKHLTDFDRNISSRKISTIDLSYLDKLKNYLLKKVSINSSIMYLTILKGAFNFAVKKDYLQKNPMINFDLPKKLEVEKEFLTIAELKRLEALESRPDALNAFLFSCYTGLRYSDVKKLRYEDISESKIKVKMLKTDKYVYIPLSNKANELIDRKIINHSGLVFKLRSLPYDNGMIKKMFKIAEVKKNKISFHLSRHSFATIGLTIGIELETISKILGHKNLATTQIYAKIVNEKMKLAVEKFDSI